MLITRLLTTNNRRRRQRLVGSDRSVALQCCQVLTLKSQNRKKMFQKQAQSRGKKRKVGNPVALE